MWKRQVEISDAVLMQNSIEKHIHRGPGGQESHAFDRGLLGFKFRWSYLARVRGTHWCGKAGGLKTTKEFKIFLTSKILFYGTMNLNPLFKTNQLGAERGGLRL